MQVTAGLDQYGPVLTNPFELTVDLGWADPIPCLREFSWLSIKVLYI